MKCPFCSFEESKVIDSRPTDEGERIRRRRECMSCGKRFTTYEIIESVPIVVVKKDKSREVLVKNALFPLMLSNKPSMKWRLNFRTLLTEKLLQLKSASMLWINSKILMKWLMFVLHPFTVSLKI